MIEPSLETIGIEAGKLADRLEGYLTQREVTFLSTLPFLPTQGEILEIGSYKGKSTVLLASILKALGRKRLVACDPYLLESPTDPKGFTAQQVYESFLARLSEHGVADHVEFHKLRSEELAAKWDRPLAVLWIDGDHTYAGALRDLEGFQEHLQNNAVVCFHDVLHRFDGPIRVFTEKMVLSDRFPLCGCCGSIGWGLFRKDRSPSATEWKAKLALYNKLEKLIEPGVRVANSLPYSKIGYKLHRNRVPHGPIVPADWIKQIEALAAST